jgi:two-component system, chemotaxis family, CheB/CheR fusion protein
MPKIRVAKPRVAKPGKTKAAARTLPTPRVRGVMVPDSQPRPETQIRIVGIGASAGGLEALEHMFQAMPVDSGMAFCIVQHLSPDFRSMMDELLARQSMMTIRHAAAGMQVEPNTVYLNPPRQNLLIADGRLYLNSPEPSEMPNHPIDAFFTSLAQDRAAQAIGVILSGTGTDGTKGALAILQAGGAVLVQEPASAKFDNMPRNAIEKGAATLAALPDEIPALLVRISHGEPLDLSPRDDLDHKGGSIPADPEAAILRLLEKRFGANFGYYKKTTVRRRLARRAALNGMHDLSNFAQLLRRDPTELERMYADLLIGVTAFFRDRAAFESLSVLAVPRLCAQMTRDRPLRVWVPGCASGEEAYSLAILFSEYARKNDLPLHLKIFATDLHHGSLETAGQGIYSAQSLKELELDVRKRYFDSSGGRYQAKPGLRRLIVFSPHNIIKDPPFTRLDLVSCRNLLIYFDEVAQKKVLSLFHFSLHQDGILFLGPSETAGDIREEFESLDSRWRIFSKFRNVPLPGSTRLLPSALDDLGPQISTREAARNRISSTTAPVVRSDRRQLLHAYDAMLERYAPPSVLASHNGDLIHVFGAAQQYLRLKAGLFSTRLIDVVVEPLKLAVSACIDGTRLPSVAPVIREVTFRAEDGTHQRIQIKAEILPQPGLDHDNVLVTFIERKSEPARTFPPAQPVEYLDEHAALQGRVRELERHLQFSEESRQTTIEELESSNEELQSSNEELMSANEELQSTNEELHAVNEELFSVSSEHQRKIDELTALTNDMDHLLRCTDVGTIFLDQDLRIRRFTPAAAKAFNLLERDCGRPIDHITARFSYPELTRDVAQVSNTGQPVERTVALSEMTLLIRVFPFKVADATRGIVITLIDVTRLKRAEQVNSSLEQFTYIVSHDLRAPLRTILNSARWIEEDLGDAANEEIRSHCHRLMTYSNRLTDMLDDLMKYARLEEPNQAVEVIDIRHLLKSIVETLDGEDRLVLQCRGALVPLASHRVPLTQVFQNLIDNAIKYGDKPKVILTVTAEDLGTHVRYSVSDNGPGIPPRHHEKIFLPFRKLEHKDTKPGTGMGLALVKKAINDNGGTIEVISNPELKPGATFRFTWNKLTP